MKVLLDTNIVLDYLGANQGLIEDTKNTIIILFGKKAYYDKSK